MLLPDVAYFRTQRFELGAYGVAPDSCCRQQRQFFRRGLQGLLVLVHLLLQGVELMVRNLQQTVGCGELILCRLEFDFLMQLAASSAPCWKCVLAVSISWAACSFSLLPQPVRNSTAAIIITILFISLEIHEECQTDREVVHLLGLLIFNGIRIE